MGGLRHRHGGEGGEGSEEGIAAGFHGFRGWWPSAGFWLLDFGWEEKRSQLVTSLGIVSECGIFRYRSNEG